MAERAASSWPSARSASVYSSTACLKSPAWKAESASGVAGRRQGFGCRLAARARLRVVRLRRPRARGRARGRAAAGFARHQLGDCLEACGQRALRAGDGFGRRCGRAAKLRAHEWDVFILWGNETRSGQRAVRQDQKQQWALASLPRRPTRTWRMSSAMREVHSASGRCAGAKGRRTDTGSHLPPPSSGSASRHRTGAVRSSGVCRVLTLSPYSLKRMSRLPSTASSSAPTT